MIINAEKIKTNGAKLFKKILETYDEVIVNFRGENKYAIIDINRYLDLECHENKILLQHNEHPITPKKISYKSSEQLEISQNKLDKKLKKVILGMKKEEVYIQANEVKTQGISSFKNLFDADKTIVIQVRGRSTYVVLDIDRYKLLLTLEKDFMYNKAISSKEKFPVPLAEDDDVDIFIKSLFKNLQ